MKLRRPQGQTSIRIKRSIKEKLNINPKTMNTTQINKAIEDEMVAFGIYLLSQHREERISEANKRNVTHADLCNYKYYKK